MTSHSRKHRDLDRARIAALRLGAAAVAVNGLKLRVEDMIERGPCDPMVRARYGGRAGRLGSTLDEAIARATEEAQDASKRSEATSVALRELRVILRLIRQRRHRTGFDHYPGILAFTRDMVVEHVVA